MTPKDEVWSLGKATLWRYRRPEVRHGPPVLLFLGPGRRLGDLRPSPGQLLGRTPGRRGLRRLPVRLGQARGRRGRPHPRHVPQRLLRPRRRRRAPHRGGGRGLAGRLLHGRADGVCCCSAAASDVPARQPRPVHAALRLRALPGVPRNYREGRLEPADAIDETTGLVPEGADPRACSGCSQPTSDVVQYVTLWENLWRDDYVRVPPRGQPLGVEPPRDGRAGVHRADHEYVRDNALMKGAARLGGRARRARERHGADAVVVAERDEFVPPANSEPLAGSARLRRRRGPPRARRPRRSADGLGRPAGDHARGRGLAASAIPPRPHTARAKST